MARVGVLSVYSFPYMQPLSFVWVFENVGGCVFFLLVRLCSGALILCWDHGDAMNIPRRSSF